MASFNGKAQGIRTTNLSGNAAYRLGNREKLATQVLTSFLHELKYYGDNTPQMIELAREVASVDGPFVARLAIYARKTMGMRSTTHMLCAVLAHEAKDEAYVRPTLRTCVVRGDDVTETLCAYKGIFPGEALPNSLRRAMRDALEEMDDYEIAKYQMRGRQLTMADAIKICHPARREAFVACIEGRLPVPEGWQTALSREGNTAKTWERLIDEDRIPYMAALRNLRNMLKAGPSNIDLALARLTNPEAVRHSRQLPFRYYSAWNSVRDMASSKVLDALEAAIATSIDNYPRLTGRTVVAVDVSGSMSARLSRMSSITYADVAALLGVCVARLSDDCVLYTFEGWARRVSISGRAGILSQMDALRGSGGWTNMGAVFEEMSSDRVDCDRIIILSDNEVNGGFRSAGRGGVIQLLADRYRKEVGHDVWVHAADMAGYGTVQFVGKDTSIIAGWSEKILQLIPMAEQGQGGMLAAIEAVELPA